MDHTGDISGAKVGGRDLGNFGDGVRNEAVEKDQIPYGSAQ